jgi:hypothetical protein
MPCRAVGCCSLYVLAVDRAPVLYVYVMPPRSARCRWAAHAAPRSRARAYHYSTTGLQLPPSTNTTTNLTRCNLHAHVERGTGSGVRSKHGGGEGKGPASSRVAPRRRRGGAGGPGGSARRARAPRARPRGSHTTRAFGRGGVLPAIIYAGGRGSSAPRPSMADRWLRFAFDPFFLSSARRAHWGAQGAAPRPAHDGERSIEREPALGDDSELGRVRLPCSGARLMVLL